jgi:hypothetical protein
VQEEEVILPIENHEAYGAPALHGEVVHRPHLITVAGETIAVSANDGDLDTRGPA